MTTPAATELLFLPGFDGRAELRAEFIAALGERHPARGLSYPNAALESLSGYARHVSALVPSTSRPVLIAESFSGLVAAHWAARDPHVAGLVLCGAFARNPLPWTMLGATLPSMAQFFGAHLLAPWGLAARDEKRRKWSQGLSDAVAALERGVIAERLRLIADEDVSRELASLRIPVIIVNFDHDLVIGASSRRALQAACPGAAIVKVDGPHFAIETRPRESAAAILAYVTPLFAAQDRGRA
jgi:pimeloyl-[acyl-carrier protein] methyl ester esterase